MPYTEFLEVRKRSRTIADHVEFQLRLQSLMDNGKKEKFVPCETADFGKYPHLHIGCEMLRKFAHACHTQNPTVQYTMVIPSILFPFQARVAVSRNIFPMVCRLVSILS